MFSFWFVKVTQELEFYCNSFHTNTITAFRKVLNNRCETRLCPCNRDFLQELILYSLSKGRYFTTFVETEDSLSCHQSPPLASISRRIHCIPPHHITFKIIVYIILQSILWSSKCSLFVTIWNCNVVCLMGTIIWAGPALPLLSDNQHYVRIETAGLARLQQDGASTWLIEKVVNVSGKILGNNLLLTESNFVQVIKIIIIIIMAK